MKTIIQLRSEVVAHDLILRTVLVVAPIVMIAGGMNLVAKSPLWVAINYTIVAIAPLAGFIHISNRLPKVVADHVRSQIPQHIEYVSKRELVAELAYRHAKEVHL